ncbi:methylenetetrahydrofolate reductase (NADPH) [Agromyces flavus]|uniref:Methylenetetrahydrofolate reductase n=1 Tax=Agromyces flavus TaxID=589382 RepID=A0A1H1SZT7_9MICO|nr:methylenetetrahydrofolate reductase [Agromyces flavus]MCP2369266.1 methylenetetrahydrofolate reductase (NADPH) [Agromyces flavus]GGI48760.1 methylenetetrahydrofolate reductase [Agromyces flavus]SDS53236.1 methylenetetrahydrofolate reductase (NADPH) [Agromyces flavus]
MTGSAPVGDAVRPRPPISFELFPPRTDAAALALGRTIDRLAEVDPAFISVTFGAGGSSRDRSLTVLRYMLEHTDVEPMAHLTCVGSSHAEANRLVREFLDAGITSFLALRGDPPEGADPEAGIGDLRSAAELVQLIHRVQEEREPYGQAGIPGIPGATRIRERPRPERVAVAAFPTGHPRSRGFGQDIDVLLAKEVAGANLAITQLFWHADDYLGFVERARAGGVTIPILPGIMPVTTPARLARLEQLTGVPAPSELAIPLEIEPDADALFELGVDFAAALAAEVLADAPGLHLYTFNRHEAVLAVLDRLGLRTIPAHAGTERNTRTR